MGVVLMTLATAGCGPAPVATGINDPREAENREVHAFNKAVDRAFLGGGSGAYTRIVPEPVRLAIGNVVGNADTPRMVVNNLLQGRIDEAAQNGFRFLVNTTIGFAGLLDPATEMGLPAAETDFGETLHIWGAGEGTYVELPFLGPSTERDAFGKVVDLALNPLKFALPDRERGALFALGVLDRVGDRGRFSETVDSILYESADSYAQARLLYLQNRRFELGGEAGAEFEDPYDDPYFDPYEDLDGQ